MRTQVAIKLGRENFYLYSAIEPATGEDFTLEMPTVNTNCMNAFLQEISVTYNAEKLLIVMDQAGWHKSKTLQVPDNIEIIYLPPYSPELNPVEKFWQFIKQNTIKNKVYQTLDDIKNTIADFILKISKNTTLSLTQNFISYVKFF